MSKKVVLTGLRTNSEYHIGNYLGAILPIVQLQKNYTSKYQINLFAPDLHSFTTPVDHDNLYDQTLANLAVFVAAGIPIDQPDFYLYRQSQIPAHSELTVILNNFVYFGELRRMTQFKEKSGSENVSAGLFDYPVLMAADILLYDALYVPVGDDQRQHLELTRDVAIRFNNKFGDIFTVPLEWQKQLEFAKRTDGVRIRSLARPDKKMSKSIDDEKGTILLSDTPEQAAKKIMGATTDSVGVINYNFDSQPGVSNLLQMLALLQDMSLEEVVSKWRGKTNYGELKTTVAQVVSEFLGSFQGQLSRVDKNNLLRRLEDNEKKMSKIANRKLNLVKEVVGLRPKSTDAKT